MMRAVCHQRAHNKKISYFCLEKVSTKANLERKPLQNNARIMNQ